MILTTQQAEAVRACAATLKFLGLVDTQAQFVFPDGIRVSMDTKVGPEVCVWCRNLGDCAVYPNVEAFAAAYDLSDSTKEKP